ncbi:Putative hemerythrin-like protein [Georgfuchsia toluolica]|uniref:Hemerythrin-like protein n=1 Tax=Georgfuchsia toluolica TaxID=424218 RepID=A0A916NIM3_9PROT|nr:bacteriohemerythrin [Georgfuchsia toluolica]CAG4884711.1 Putative hemerythrin-like protein [Georgfuchsia toluolica]
MQWKPEYFIGIKEIDDQHEDLIAQFSNVEKFVTARRNRGQTHYALVELAQVARRHFDFEEALMRLFGIPGAEKHKTDHEYFFIKMAEIEQHSLRASTDTEMIRFLHAWLRDHILAADRQDYAEFILGVAPVVKSKMPTSLPENAI